MCAGRAQRLRERVDAQDGKLCYEAAAIVAGVINQRCRRGLRAGTRGWPFMCGVQVQAGRVQLQATQCPMMWKVIVWNV